MLLDKSFVGVYQPTPVSLLEDFPGSSQGSQRGPPHGASNGTPGGLDKNTRDTFRD